MWGGQLLTSIWKSGERGPPPPLRHTCLFFQSNPRSPVPPPQHRRPSGPPRQSVVPALFFLLVCHPQQSVKQRNHHSMVSVALSHSLVKPPPGTGPRVSSFRHRDQHLQSRPREFFNSRICPHDFANSQIREFANSQIREFANSPPFTTSSRACQMVGRGAFGARAALREPDSMPHRNSPPHPTYFPPDLRRPPFALPHRPFACGAAPASPWDRTDLSGLVWGGVQPRNQTRSWTGGGLPFFVPPPLRTGRRN